MGLPVATDNLTFHFVFRKSTKALNMDDHNMIKIIIFCSKHLLLKGMDTRQYPALWIQDVITGVCCHRELNNSKVQ